MKCTVHDLDIMGSNFGQVELGVCSASVYVVLEPKLEFLELTVLILRPNIICHIINVTKVFKFSGAVK